MAEVLLGDPAAGVGHFDLDPRLSGARRDGDRAWPVHPLGSIIEQVHKDLQQLGRVGFDDRQVRIVLAPDRPRRRQRAARRP